MNKSKKLYIYATIMIVSFLFAVIAFITITLKNIVSFNSYESSSVYEIETITTCTTSETLLTSYSTSTDTLTTSAQTSSTVVETSQMITSKHTSSETTTVTTLTDKDQIIAITNYQIVVIPDETTVKSTKAITSMTTAKTETTVCATTTTQVVIGNEDVRSSANFVKTFTRGTYYPGWEGYGSTQVYGGSGRLLMDCSIKDDEIKGSVACKYIQERYGYNYSGARTIVYLDIPEVSDMSGFYFLDDSCLRDDTIDFYFTYKANCPFMNQGVLKTITCYIVPNGGND